MTERLSVDDLIDGIWDEEDAVSREPVRTPPREPQEVTANGDAPTASSAEPPAPIRTEPESPTEPESAEDPPTVDLKPSTRRRVKKRLRVSRQREASSPPEPEPAARRRRGIRRRVRRQVRMLALIVMVVGVVGAAAVASLRSGGPRSSDAKQPLTVGDPAQEAIVWTIWREDPPGPAYVAVVGIGGREGPVVVGVPEYTVASIPGHGVGTVGDVARIGDRSLMETTVANIFGIGIDGSVATTFDDLRDLVDRLGEIVVGERSMTGQEVVTFLGEGRHEEVGEIEFLRGQDVFLALMQAGGTSAVAAHVPEGLVRILAAAEEGEVTLLELPVEGIGAGLARPDEEAVAKLTGEWFLPTATSAHGVRLVILNGKGTPGIGEEVTRILVPSGFRLVSSQNAMSFNVKVTQIVASTEEFLDEARLAQQLLGVGRVYLGDQPTGVADVSIIVGRDFPPE
ncbi:MAG: LytR C-terminal domain-containing protein [Actinomycetota bacterium]